MSATCQDLRRRVREVCAFFPNEYWRELDAERKFRETRLYQVAPISTEHVLGLPRSF
jgi:hypothetical protein